MPREILTVQVGQCGNQLGCKMWDVLVEEHLNAMLQPPAPPHAVPSSSSSSAFSLHPTDAAFDALSCMFEYIPHRHLPSGADSSVSGEPTVLHGRRGYAPTAAERHRQSVLTRQMFRERLRARCVAVDLEEGVLNAMSRGPLGNLFDARHFVSDVSGAGNNWAVGHLEYGDRYIDSIQESVRRATERCDSLQGFLLIHSLGGGTGSGLGSRCLGMLEEAFPDVFRFVAAVLPPMADGLEDVVTAPYNTCFALREVIEHADCVFPVDNSALIAMSDAALKGSGADASPPQHGLPPSAFSQQLRRPTANEAKKAFSIAEPTATKLPFDSMNSIAAQMLSNLTCGVRFPGSLNMDVNEISTNLVPYPRLHFMVPSMSPLSATRHNLAGAKHIDGMFADLLQPDHSLLTCDARRHTSLACAFLARGHDVVVEDFTRNVPKVFARMRMVYFNPNGCKTAMCSQPPVGLSQAMLMLNNTCAMADPLSVVRDKFAQLYRVRSHAHHYERYLEATYFEHTLDIISSVIDDYAGLNEMYAGAEGVPKPPQSLRQFLTL